ncbi:MAG: helix-turn-helix domain-containing protein [Spirochaetales bacterium]|nr:helix-turn-helix domain-containing protein [Spirochaetales bacterium]
MDKQKIFKNKGTHYFKYLGTSLIIFIIPVLIISIYFNSRFMSQFKEEIINTVDMELSQLALRSDGKIDEMMETASRLMIDPTINSARKAKDPYQLLPLINYISIITSSNDYAEDIFINIFSSDYMVTYSTTWKKEYFFKENFNGDNTKYAKEYFDTISFRENWPLCVTSSEIGYDDGFLFYIIPLYSDFHIRYGNIIFKVKESSISKMISAKMKSYNALIFIKDSEGKLIFSSSNSVSDSSVSSREYISPTTGWHYTALLPDTQQIFSKVTSISKEYMITVTLTTLFCFILIMYIQEKLYAPIKDLGEKVKNVISDTEKTNNEFKGISKAIDILSTQNTDLASTLDANMTDIKNSRLYRLINGVYDSVADFNTDNMDLGLTLYYQYVTILIVAVSSTNVDLNSFAANEKNKLKDKYLFYYCTAIGRKEQIVFILNSNDEDSGKTLAQDLLSNAMLENISLTIGVGCPTDDLSKAGQSYIEASGALDHRYVKGNNRVITFSEISGSVDKKALYPNSEMMALKNALAANNLESIAAAMDGITQIIKNDDLPVYLVRCIISDMLNLINRYFPVSGEHENITMRLSAADTVQEVIDIAEMWKDSIWKSVKAKQKLASSINEIKQYIDANCLKPEFSAYETADRFNLTLPALSKLFKESFGENLIDYTTSMRMETAKQLLMETELSVSEISDKVGYYNLSSFTRRFKQSQGISPTEYRSISRTNR